MTSSEEWQWETRRGDAATLHEPTPPSAATRTALDLRVDGVALVLGSSQRRDEISVDEAGRRDIAVVRRRSGGGAVLLVPDDHVWIDLWLPRGDPLWDDDVGRAGEWLADVWVEALTTIGRSELAVHRGPVERTAWSTHVCFAGMGPGEVSSGGRKLVGVSQRRTRDWVRFQSLVHREWDAATTFGLLSVAGASTAAHEWRSRVAEIGDAAIVSAFATALSRRT